MPGHQFLKRLQVARLRRPDQGIIGQGGTGRSVFMGSTGGWRRLFNGLQPAFGAGQWPAIRGSRWQAASTAFGEGFDNASAM